MTLRRDDVWKKGIDISHISLGVSHNKGRKFIRNLVPLEKILTVNSTYHRAKLKKRLLDLNLLNEECYECHLGSTWNNKKLSLQIDHINGVHNDNRLENLRMLCPNCHSQTPSFAGKQKRKLTTISANEPKIDRRKIGGPRLKARKVERPSKEKLKELMRNVSMVKIGKMYGVSDNAIRKWAKSYGIM